MGEWEQMASALASLGEDASVLSDQETALVMAEGHHLLGLREVPGLHIQARESEEGVQARIEVAEGVRIQRPVHLCFGLLRRYGGQRILLDVQVGKGAEVTFMAHCLFMFAEMAEHRMEASMILEEGARVSYHEGHYHGPFGGIEVLPKARIRVGKGARFENTFSLTSGRVGKLVLDVQVEVEEKGVAELISKVFGHGADTVMIREKAILSGKGARGLVKSRVVVEDEALAEVVGITEGHAPGARGHVDCVEVVKDQAVASAMPAVKVTHPQAQVTHEAAIGRIDPKQLETLMAHGLDPEEAVEMIVMGMLR